MANKEYWKGIEQLTNAPEFVKNAENEFPQHLPIKDAYGDNSEGEFKTNRRDFMKVMGFSIAAVSLAACEAPVHKAIPYLNKPEDVDPGVPNYYASTYMMGSEVAPVVVKTREGRPIFIEGNTFSDFSKGGTSARMNASVLSLYDNEKVKTPSKAGNEISWKELDTEVTKGLAAAAKVAVVTHSIVSPSTKLALDKFAEKFEGKVEVVTYDTDTASAMLEANKTQFGKAVVPGYQFGKADVVVSFGADFLGNWISPIEYTAHFMPSRKVGPKKKEMSQLFSFETMLSVTGAAADYRTPVKPSQEGLAVVALYNELAKATGNAPVNAAAFNDANIGKAAKALLNAKGKSLVVSGINNVAVQLLVNGINQMLGNYGQTIDLDNPSYQRQGNDKAFNTFVDGLKGGQYGAVVFYNANPVYDHPRGAEIAEGLKKVKLSVSTNDRLDETASVCQFNAPDTHYLEAWNDAEPRKGYFALTQPTISKIFNTRQAQDSFLTWAEVEEDFEDIIKSYWKNTLFSLQSKELTFESFWVRSLHNGVFEPKNASYTSVLEGDNGSVNYSASFDVAATSSAVAKAYKAKASGTELVVYTSTVIGDGLMANNPILQEIPDPITKVCWGNFIAVTPAHAKSLGFDEFETKKSVAKVVTQKGEFELPVIMQPGLAEGTVAVSLGYGRDPQTGGKVAEQAAGYNAYTQLSFTEGQLTSFVEGVEVTNTGRKEDLAQTQTHETIMSRKSIIQETTLGEYKKKPNASKYGVEIESYSGKTKPTDLSVWDVSNDGFSEEAKENTGKVLLWNERIGLKADHHKYSNHHWGLAIDLNTCTGCSACVVACNVENNVPVVGKQEVVNRREMHWLRIDRYYSQRPEEEFTEEEKEELTDYDKMERAARNPEVVFQPMMCQHCNNAPCETVCPVAATTHSSEGLNQMTYNRCVGTKYCGNNCPYKVRRFNWFKYHNNHEFDYHLNNDLGKMVLNPDVTVRSRGVMEKCSMCVQRIQAGKLKAKVDGREMNDGDATTACASACPTHAIQFGDLNNTNSGIRQLLDGELDERAYNVLDEINVRPNVYYLGKVRNKEASKA